MSEAEDVKNMVLKCSRTGKLFFTEKDAKQHNDDTGFAEFEQVSLDDKVWICAETGKVCVSETEMSIYKRRDPTAKTFDEKTVGFLKERHDASRRKPAAAREPGAPAEDGAEPMDVDAPAAEPQPMHISKEVMDQLMEMGFTQPRAEKALVRTSNGGLEAAVGWLADHSEDADIDAPLDVLPLLLPQAQIDEAAAARSINSQLTPEEKQAKLQAAVEAAQRKREEQEKEEEKAREKRRRESGKQMVKTKAELEEAQRKRDAEARRKEKQDDLRHRAYLREQLERDKAERRAKREAAGLPPLTSDKPAPTPPAEPPKPAEPAAAAAPRPAAPPPKPVEMPVVPVPEAIDKVCTNRDFLLESFVETATKLGENVLKNPSEVRAAPTRRARRVPRAGAAPRARPPRPPSAHALARTGCRAAAPPRAPPPTARALTADAVDARVPAPRLRPQPKYRSVRTSNPKIHERLIRPFGGELFMVAVGWKREGECLVLPDSVAADAMATAVAQLRDTAENKKKERDAAEREKLRAERQAVRARIPPPPARQRPPAAGAMPSACPPARTHALRAVCPSALTRARRRREGRRSRRSRRRRSGCARRWRRIGARCPRGARLRPCMRRGCRPGQVAPTASTSSRTRKTTDHRRSDLLVLLLYRPPSGCSRG